MPILIVDDSATMRKLIANHLAEVGLRNVDEAQDGPDAVALAARKPYRCVFLDITLPGMNGLEVLKAIRGSGNRAPVVVVTSDSSVRLLTQAFQAGASAFVQKPFDKATFLRKARQAMGMETEALGTTSPALV
ncbi:MAG: response regulator [Deltaproteobacteria bacterium]|nr:response regulator [Deltaproteobacteria bacterium]